MTANIFSFFINWKPNTDGGSLPHCNRLETMVECEAMAQYGCIWGWHPTEQPTEEPSETPTEDPTEEPTEQPSREPTQEPSEQPSQEPTEQPSEQPTIIVF